MTHKYKSRAGVNVTHTGITWLITLGRGGGKAKLTTGMRKFHLQRTPI